MRPDLLYLSRADVRAACARIDPVALVREAFRLHALGDTVLPDECYLAWTNGGGEGVRSIAMSAYVGGAIGRAGTKVINANPCNPSRGIDRAGGLTLVHDDRSARTVCVMEGARISALRTAAVTALAAELAAGPPVRTLAVLGAGAQARAHLELLPPRLPELARVRVFDTVPARAAALRGEHPAGGGGVAVEVAETAEAAVRGAELVVAVTTTTTGYIPLAWLGPGTVVVNVSLDDVLPDVALGADRVIVDDWGLVAADPRRLLGRMVRAGALVGPDDPATPGARRVDATLGDVVTGRRPARCSAGDVVLVNPFGLALEDVALADAVYRAALELGLGVPLQR